MPKRSRAVPLSFPTVFFACLLLTTCAHAQNDATVRQGELAANTPIKILQILLENQQVTSGTPTLASVRSKSIPVRSKSIPVRTVSDVPTVYLADSSKRSIDTFLIPVPAAALQRQITPAQYFGNGTQAAP